MPFSCCFQPERKIAGVPVLLFSIEMRKEEKTCTLMYVDADFVGVCCLQR